MNKQYKLLSILIAFLLLITSLTATSSAEEAVESDNVFLLGSYP